MTWPFSIQAPSQMPSCVSQSVLANDDLLRDVDQTAGQVTGVGRTQRRIGQALSGASGGNEVFQDGQAFTEVCLDRDLNGAGRWYLAIRPRIPAS